MIALTPFPSPSPPPAVSRRRIALLIPLAFPAALPLATVACNSERSPAQRTPDEARMFGPSSMRIHPIFTRIKDWTGDNIPDGIDALVEFQDQFGDPTKASGTVIFELYQFEKFTPQRKGLRIGNPWVGRIVTEREQRDRWNRTSRTYTFPLAFAGIRTDLTYVLTAEFTPVGGGGRFFDQLVLEPEYGAYTPKELRPRPATAPAAATQPATVPSTGPSTTQPGADVG